MESLSNTIDNMLKKSWEYCKGYNDGFKEGYTKALEVMVEQEKYKPTHQILISPNDITTDSKQLTKEINRLKESP